MYICLVPMKIVVVFGGLHIELAALTAICNWLEDSGCTNTVAQSDLTSPGTVAPFITASHLKDNS